MTFARPRSFLLAALLGALALAGCEDDGGVARDGSSVLDGRDAGAGTDADAGGSDAAGGDGLGGDSLDGAGDGGLDPDALMISALAREIIAAPTPAVASLTADNRRFATRLRSPPVMHRRRRALLGEYFDEKGPGLARTAGLDHQQDTR